MKCNSHRHNINNATIKELERQIAECTSVKEEENKEEIKNENFYNDFSMIKCKNIMLIDELEKSVKEHIMIKEMMGKMSYNSIKSNLKRKHREELSLVDNKRNVVMTGLMSCYFKDNQAISKEHEENDRLLNMIDAKCKELHKNISKKEDA